MAMEGQRAGLRRWGGLGYAAKRLSVFASGGKRPLLVGAGAWAFEYLYHYFKIITGYHSFLSST